MYGVWALVFYKIRKKSYKTVARLFSIIRHSRQKGGAYE